MAEIRIQRKKSAPSPWLLVALAALLLSAAAYFLLRPDVPDETAPANAATAMPADSLPPGSPAAQARATPPPPADETSPDAAPVASPGRAALLELLPQLTALADQPALRDAAAVREQRDNLTSATDRLAADAARAGLRPGLVAVANFLRAAQQQAAPDQADAATALVQQAAQLSGHDDTPAEQARNQEFLAQAAALRQALEDAINR